MESGERAVPEPRLCTLNGTDRDRAIPILKESFTGVYRWHAKRTLHTISLVRALEAEGRIVGASLLELLVPEAGYVYYIFVGTADRHRGYGSRLLDDALAYFREKRVQVVYAAAEEENHASLGLFRSRGFRVVAREEQNFRDGGLGAQGIRSRMWVVRGEVLLGTRLSPASGPRPTDS